mmetsp:Transcript_2177/g.3672  ORF Transcript_2177/g.3672 Transcript_2177/m.3672 type:complete len:220 (+) Transcript_2177:62-721(+)
MPSMKTRTALPRAARIHASLILCSVLSRNGCAQTFSEPSQATKDVSDSAQSRLDKADRALEELELIEKVRDFVDAQQSEDDRAHQEKGGSDEAEAQNEGGTSSSTEDVQDENFQSVETELNWLITFGICTILTLAAVLGALITECEILAALSLAMGCHLCGWISGCPMLSASAIILLVAYAAWRMPMHKGSPQEMMPLVSASETKGAEARKILFRPASN